MSATYGVDKRDVVPRWRDVRRTLLAGELPVHPPTPASQGQLEFLELREDEWHEHPTETRALEFVSTALILGQLDRAADALAFLSTDSPSRWVSQVRASEWPEAQGAPLDPAQPDSVASVGGQRARIGRLRRRVRRDPRQALAWSELARCYTSLGLLPQAQKALFVALRLAPSSRYVLRNAASFYIHTGDPERAHSVLTRADATPGDPWLVAAEVATAHVAGRPSTLAKRGRRMVEGGDFSAFDLTELASELATLELAAGKRQARRLFEKALLDPNDNSLAQAEWASQHASGINVSPEQRSE